VGLSSYSIHLIIAQYASLCYALSRDDNRYLPPERCWGEDGILTPWSLTGAGALLTKQTHGLSVSHHKKGKMTTVMESVSDQKSVKRFLSIKWVSLFALLVMLLSIGAALVARPSFIKAANATQASEITIIGVPEAHYQSRFDQITKAGYAPFWFNAYTVGDQTYFNAIFHPNNGIPWVARHNMTSDSYQREFDYWVQRGYRLTLIDSYLSHKQIRYAAIFQKKSGPAFVAYYGKTRSEQVNLFSSLTKRGYVTVNFSAVSLDGLTTYSALYVKEDVGSWAAWAGMSPAGYQAWFNENQVAGRHLVYLSAYSDATGPHLNAIWHQKAPNVYARHGLTSSAYQALYDKERAAGFHTQAVTAYEENGKALFAAFWTR
jgi:hypothetical protein